MRKSGQTHNKLTSWTKAARCCSFKKSVDKSGVFAGFGIGFANAHSGTALPNIVAVSNGEGAPAQREHDRINLARNG